MKLTFLGTGAADWEISDYRPGAFHRRFSSALVGEDLLIDPGPHIFHFERTEGTPGMFAGVKNMIVTHTHGDHFHAETVWTLARAGAVLWGDEACRRRLVRDLGERAADVEFHPLPISRGEPCRVGKYDVYSLASNHESADPEEQTRLYVIGDGERMLFYGCDSSLIPTKSWNVIGKMPLDALVLECTCGTLAPDDWRLFEHNTLEMLEGMVRTFRKYSLFSPGVKYYCSHMARTLHGAPEELARRLSPLGVTPAYDGLTVEI